MSEITEQFNQILPLVEQLYAKHPAYVVLDLTLGTRKDGNIDKPYVEYNIYTPEISHNNYDTFDGFMCFLRKLVEVGVTDIRARWLEDKIAKANDYISETEKELLGYKQELRTIKERKEGKIR